MLKRSFAVLVLAFAVLFSQTARADAGEDELVALVCGRDSAKLTLAPPTVSAEFVIAADGRVSRRRNANGRVLELPTVPTDPGLTLKPWIVRVDAVSSVDPAAAEGLPAVQCGALAVGQRVMLPEQAPAGRNVWRVSVHAPKESVRRLGLKAPEARTDDLWKMRFAAAQATETVFAYHSAITLLEKDGSSLQTWAADVVVNNTYPLDEKRTEAVAKVVDLTPPSTDTVYRQVVKNAGDAYPVAAQGLAELTVDLMKLHAAAVDLRDKKDQTSGERFAEVWRAVKERASTFKQPGGEHCKAAWQFNVAKKPDFSELWHFGSFELPSTDDRHTVELVPSGTSADAETLANTGLTTAWVPRSGADASITFHWSAGESTETEGIKALATFITVLAKNRTAFDKNNADKGVARRFEQFTSDAACEKLPRFAGEMPLQPVAKYRSRASTSDALGANGLRRSRAYIVYACNGPCELTGSAKNIVAQRAIKTPAGWGLTLLGSLTWDTKLPGSSQFAEYRWQPTSSAGAQQVFRLEEVAVPLQSVSTSLLLTVLLPEFTGGRIGIGVGPSILFGSGTGALKQWTANLVWSPFFLRALTDKLLITTGFGVRLVDEPLIRSVGDTIALDRANQQAPSPPAVETRMATVGVYSLGIALDLSVFGEAATTLFGTKAP